MPDEIVKLLIVGDNPDEGVALRRELSRASSRPLEIDWIDRAEAEHSGFQTEEFDAVLLDVPELHDETLARVRRIDSKLPAAAIVLIVRGDNLDSAAEAIREGAQDCVLRRELKGPDLLRRVQCAIERHRDKLRLMRQNRTLVRRLEQRTGHVSLLQDVALIANEAETVERALQAAVNRICEFMDWPVGHGYSTVEIVGGAKPVDVWHLSDPERFWVFYYASCQNTSVGSTSLRGAVSVGRAPLWVIDVTSDDLGSARAESARRAGLRTGFAFPVFVAQEVVALLEFFSTEISEPDDGFLTVMAHIGTQLGRVVERRRLQQQLIEAVWQKQRTLGQDLHDGLGQELTGIGLLSESLRRRLHSSSSQHAAAADELVELIRRSQKSLRRISKGLSPVGVDADGLQAALEELADEIQTRCRIPCRFRSSTVVTVSDNDVATHLYRIAQEAVNNAVKHARPRQIEIELGAGSGGAELQVRDDGVGIRRIDDSTQGIGLKTMKYRAGVIDAAFDVRAVESGGTLVSCTIRRKDE